MTPAALASRTLLAARCSFEYWSMPELIDWMNRSFEAAGIRSFFHMPEASTTSASPIRFTRSS